MSKQQRISLNIGKSIDMILNRLTVFEQEFIRGKNGKSREQGKT